MGLNTQQGVHVWHHAKSKALVIKVDGDSYWYTGEVGGVHLREAKLLVGREPASMTGYKRMDLARLRPHELAAVYAAIKRTAQGGEPHA